MVIDNRENVFSDLFDANMEGDNSEKQDEEQVDDNDKSELTLANEQDNDKSELTLANEQDLSDSDAKENRSVDIEEENNYDAIKTNRFDGKSLEQEINKYNLRKRMKKTKEENFNKQHYNYLNFVMSARGRNKRCKKIKRKMYKKEEKKSKTLQKHTASKSSRHMYDADECS